MKYVSGRVKDLKVGISNYSEDKFSLDIVGIVTAGSYTTGSSSLHSTGADIGTLNVTGVGTIGSGGSGYAELQYQGVKKLETTSGGVDVFNIIRCLGGTAPRIQFFGDVNGVDTNTRGTFGLATGANQIVHGTGANDVALNTPHRFFIGHASTEVMAKFDPDGPVQLYHDNVKRLETTGIGATVFGQLDATTLSGTLQTAAQPNVTSLGTLSSLNVTGDVSIGGTLTYEDVTNIDSIGVITARSGINVIGHSELDNINISGVVTATNFAITPTGQVNMGGNLSQTNYPVQITTVHANEKISFYRAQHDDLSDEGAGIAFSRKDTGYELASGLFSHSNGGLGVAARENIVFLTGGGTGIQQTDEALRITSSGNVGINSTAPTSKLDVDGDIKISGISTLGSGGSGQAVLQYQGDTKLQTQSWGVQLNGTLQVSDGDPIFTKTNSSSTSNTLRFRTNAGDRLTIQHLNNESYITAQVGNINLNAPVVSISTNFSVGGISTFTNEIVIRDDSPTITFDQTSGNLNTNQYRIKEASGELVVQVSSNNGASYTNGVSIGGIGNIFIPGNDKVFFGTNDNAHIVHDNSNLKIVNTTGDIDITSGSEKLSITSSGKVGIGTDDPTAHLQVYRKTEFANNPIIQARSNNGSTNELKFEIDGDGEAYFNGNVGIKSTAPQTMLDVIESSTNRTWTPGNSVVSMFERGGHNRITIVSDSDSIGEIDFGDTNDDNAGYIRYHHLEDSMSFRVDGGERLRITSTGNVGIGTTNPDEKLHVYNGAGDVTSFIEAIAGDALLNLSNSGNGNFSGINFIRERGSGQTDRNGGSIFMPSNTSNNEAFLYIQAQSTNAHAGVTGALSDNNGVRLKLHGDDGIFSVETGSTEKLRINSAGQIKIVNGGSLIVDTNPAATYGVAEALRIDDGGGVSDRALQIFEYSHSGARYHRIQFNTNTTTNGSAYTYTQGNYGGSSSIEFDNSGHLSFFTDAQVSNGSTSSITPTERLRIQSNGNVGIGTDNAISKLHVGGTFSVITQTVLTDQSHTNAARGGNALFVSNNSTVETARFYCSAAGNTMIHIESSGNVGASELHFCDQEDRTTGGDFHYEKSSGKIIYEHDNDAFKFDTNRTEKLRIMSSGDVGIGTNNPTGSNALTSNTAVLAVGIVTTNSLFSRDLKVSGISTFNDDVDFVGTPVGTAQTSIKFHKGDGTNTDLDALRFYDSTVAAFGVGHTGGFYMRGNYNGAGPTYNSFILARGNNFFIDGGTGTSIVTRTEFGRYAIVANSHNGGSGTVELYHSSSSGTATKRLETSGVGVTVYNQLDATGAIYAAGGLNASSTGNASLILDAGTGSQAGNQVSFIDFKLDGTLKANIAVNEATSGNPLEINSAGTGATKLFNAGSEKLTTTHAGAIVTGILTATSFSGDGSALTGITAEGSGVAIQNDGSLVGTAQTINFSTNLTASFSGGTATITGSGGGSGISTSDINSNRITTGTLNVTGISTFSDNTIIDGSLTVGSAVAITGGAPTDQGNLAVYGSGRNSLIIQTNNNTLDRGIAFRNNGDFYVSHISAVDAGSNTADLVFGVESGQSNVNNISERMRITQHGNVGINSTAPTATLDVLGDVKITGISTFQGNIILPDGVSAKFGNDLDGEVKHTGSNLQIQETTGNIQISNYANERDVVISSDNGSGGIATYFKADGSTGETILYYYGNEKIKTTLSGVRVSGNVTAVNDGNISFSLQDTGHGFNASTISISNGGRDLAIKAPRDIRLQPSDGEQGIVIENGGQVELYHNNIKKAETTVSGLDVTGNVVSSGNISGVDATFSGNVSVGGTLTYEDVTNIDSVGLITARSGIHVTGVGSSVGIGTDNPSALLHLHGSSPKLYFTDTDTNVETQIDNDSSAGNFAINVDVNNSVGSNSNFLIRFNETHPVSAAKFLVNQTGKVGIGTDDPESLLHLHGTGGTTSGLRIKNSAGKNVSFYMNNDTSSSAFSINYGGTGGSDIQIGNTGNVALAPSGNANVGIGTYSPDARLNVKGDTKLQGNLSVTGITTLSGDVTLNAGASSLLKLKLQNNLTGFGDNDGASVSYSTNSHGMFFSALESGGHMVFQTGANHLNNRTLIISNTGVVTLQRNQESMLVATPNSHVKLYYNNTERLSTSGIGITVTGEADVNGDLNVSGVSTFAGDLTLDKNNPTITLSDNNNNPDYQIGNINGALRFQDTTNNETKFIANTNGRVGINTDNPARDFHVEGTSRFNQLDVVGFSTFGGSGVKFFNHVPRIEMQGSNTAQFQLTNATSGTTLTDGMVMGFSSGSKVGFINICESGFGFVLKTGGTATTAARINISGVGTVSLTKGTEEMVTANPDGAVELYYNANKRLETTNTGSIVTGILTANSFSGDGSALTNLPGITGISTSGINVTGITSATAFANFDYLQAPFGSTVTFTVTVASKDSSHRYNGTGSGSAYLINGVQAPFLTLTPGRTYRFTNDNTGSHPLKFYLEADKTTEYTSGVSFQNSYTEITVGDETPTVLHYQCTAHGYMGNAIQTNSNVVNTNYAATLRDSLTVSGNINANGNIVGDNSTAITGIANVTGQNPNSLKLLNVGYIGNAATVFNNSFLHFNDQNVPAFGGGGNFSTLASVSGLNLIFDSNNNDNNGLVIGSGSTNTSLMTTHMVVTHVGDVGIGSTTPTSKLDVNGNVNISNGALVIESVSPTLSFNDTTGTPDYKIRKQSGHLMIMETTQTNDSEWRLSIRNGGTIDIPGDLDVHSNLDIDGHTELDNLNVSGISTFVGNAQFDGRLLIGTTIEGHANADDLTIATSGDTGMTIRSGTSHNGRIYFSDATSGAGEVVGSLDYDHNDNRFSIVTNGSEALRIDSSGRLLLGTTTEGHPNADDLTVATSADTGITIRSGTTHNGRIYFSDATSGAGEVVGSLDYDHNDNKFSIFTNGGERFRIDGSGNVNINSGILTATSFVGDGSGLTGIAVTSTDASFAQVEWDVVNNGSSSYRFTGPGNDGAEDNPDIYLVRGQKYIFNVNASGHPFLLRVQSGGSNYTDGVTNNGAQSGQVIINVQHDAPAQLVYQCQYHGGMVGNIYIVGQHLANGANNRLVTATSAYGLTGESNLTYDGTTFLVGGEYLTLTGTGYKQITAATTTNNSAAIKLQNSAKNFTITNVTGGKFVISEASDSRFEIQNGLVTIPGNVSIGGTLTYEDVTNIDSVGIITARSNIDAQASINLANSIIHTGDTDTKIAFTDNEIDFQAAGGSRLKVTQFATYVQSGHPLAFLATGGGATPHIKSGGTNNQDLLFTAGAGNPTRIRIKSDGNVGIGTNDPDQKLHVYNGSGNVTSFVEAIAGDAVLDLSNSGNGNFSGINFTRERSDNTGIVGGSIFMPSNTANNEAFLYIQAQSASGNAGVTGALSANNGVRLKLHGDDGIFSVETGADERLRITSSGNVGINSTAPTSKLDVGGDVKVSGVLTATSFSGDGSNLTGVTTTGDVQDITGIATGIGTFISTAGSLTNIDSFAYASTDYKTAEYTVHIMNGSNTQAQKVLVMQNGTTAHSQEYAVMSSSDLLVSIGASISGGNVLLNVNPQSGVSGITTYRWRREVQL